MTPESARNCRHIRDRSPAPGENLPETHNARPSNAEPGSALIFAEIQAAQRLAAEWIFRVARVATGTEIEPVRLRVLVVEHGPRQFHLVDLFRHFLEMVSVEVSFSDLVGIEGRKDFHPHYISSIVQWLPAQIAREVKHRTRSFKRPEPTRIETSSNVDFDSKQKLQIEESLFLTIFADALAQGKICSARAPIRECFERTASRPSRIEDAFAFCSA